MKNSEITSERFNKLRPIIVTNMHGKFEHYRLVRRNKIYSTCAFLFTDEMEGPTVLTVLHRNSDVSFKQ